MDKWLMRDESTTILFYGTLKTNFWGRLQTPDTRSLASSPLALTKKELENDKINYYQFVSRKMILLKA